MVKDIKKPEKKKETKEKYDVEGIIVLDDKKKDDEIDTGVEGLDTDDDDELDFDSDFEFDDGGD